MNKTIITGNLTREPELNETSSGVVFSKEEYSDYLILQKNHEFIREKAKELQADNERLYKNLGKFKQSVSKETAEKIYKDIRLFLDDKTLAIITRYFKEILGVEIKE